MAKIKQKLSKEQKRLLIALSIGDGTISSNFVMKLSHSTHQKEYLEWKLKQLDNLKLKNNGIKKYISKTGFNTGKEVLYSQLSVIPTIKALRRIIYTPKKKLTSGLLEWLDAKGLAIWYMDDGYLNINLSKQRSSKQYTIKLATCVDLETVNEIIKYFKDTWSVNFRSFPEGPDTFSIASCAYSDAVAFVDIVKDYIKEVPSLLYKIRTDFTKEEFLHRQNMGILETRDTF